MKIRRLLQSFLLVLLAAVTACTGTVVQFKSTTDHAYDTTKSRIVQGSSCGFQLLTFIPIMINDRAQRAYSQVSAAAGSDVLGEIKVNEKWTYAFVGTIYCTEIQAKAYPLIAPTQAAPVQEKKQSSIDECIKACKENTKRTSEQCFDDCKR